MDGIVIQDDEQKAKIIKLESEVAELRAMITQNINVSGPGDVRMKSLSVERLAAVLGTLGITIDFDRNGLVFRSGSVITLVDPSNTSTVLMYNGNSNGILAIDITAGGGLGGGIYLLSLTSLLPPGTDVDLGSSLTYWNTVYAAGLWVSGSMSLGGTKTYYVSDSSGGAVNRKLTFRGGILVEET